MYLIYIFLLNKQATDATCSLLLHMYFCKQCCLGKQVYISEITLSDIAFSMDLSNFVIMWQLIINWAVNCVFA